MLFRNREHAQQLKIFDGLQWGKLSPTDLDGIIEFGNRLWVIIEVKYNNAPLPRGQALLLERLTDALQSPERVAACLVGTHHAYHADIYIAECVVSKYRYQGAWHIPKERITIQAAIEELRSKYL